MPTARTPISVSSFTTFGELLRYLRTRQRLTQRDLSIAVGYLLDQLNNRSLVTVVRHGDSPARFGMPETVREYAREKLGASDEIRVLREQHLHYFVSFFEQAEPQLRRAPHYYRFSIRRGRSSSRRSVASWACRSLDQHEYKGIH